MQFANAAPLDILNNLRLNNNASMQGIERLSSGVRVNSAADDPSGVAMINNTTSQLKRTQAAGENIQDTISFLQIREAAAGQVEDMVMRIRDLAVKAANEATMTTEQRSTLQSEATELVNAINKVNDMTTFNGRQAFQLSFQTVPGGTGGLVQPGQARVSVDLSSYGTTVDIYASWYNGFSMFPDLNLLSPDGTEAFGYLYVANGPHPGVNAYIGGTGQQTVANPTIHSATSVKYWGYDGYTGSGGWDEEKFTIVDPAPGLWTLIVDNEQATPIDWGIFINEPAIDPTPHDLVLVGADFNASTTMHLGNYQVNSVALSLGADFSSAPNARNSISNLDDVLKTLSDHRTTDGTMINIFQEQLKDNVAAATQLSSTRSKIQDADMASEITSFAKSQIISQASVNMLAGANSRLLESAKTLLGSINAA